MKKISKKSVLETTDGGLKLFQLLLPNLKMIGGRNETNIDSPVSTGKRCFSVFKSNDKYLFMDHYTKACGDIFEMIAKMNNLNSKQDFKKVLELISEILDTSAAIITEDQKEYFSDENTGDVLSLLSVDISKEFVKQHFMSQMPYLDSVPSYSIKLVNNFELTVTGKNIQYEFDYSKPEEAFYAIVIRDAQYYILFNPKTKLSYKWGQQPEFYYFGFDNLFTTAYVNHIYLRDTIVVTNKVEGVLWCEDKGIPCLALLEDEQSLPASLVEIVLAKFKNKFLLMHLFGKGCEQINCLTKNYGFTNIITGESYLYQFFKQNDKARDKVLDQFEVSAGFEYKGFKNPVQKIK